MINLSILCLLLYRQLYVNIDENVLICIAFCYAFKKFMNKYGFCIAKRSEKEEILKLNILMSCEKVEKCMLMCCKQQLNSLTVMKQKKHNGSIPVLVKRRRLKEVSEKMK